MVWSAEVYVAAVALVASVIFSAISLFVTLRGGSDNQRFQKHLLQQGAAQQMVELWLEEPLKSSRHFGWRYLDETGANPIDMTALRSSNQPVPGFEMTPGQTMTGRQLSYCIGQVFEFFTYLSKMIATEHIDKAYAQSLFGGYWESWSAELHRVYFPEPEPGKGNAREIANIRAWYQNTLLPIGAQLSDAPINLKRDFKVAPTSGPPDVALAWNRKS